jgi:RHS repeat-associated protein
MVVDTATGVVAQRIDYDEWGGVTQNTNPGFQPFGFAGGMVDDSSGLVRFGARDYDPSAGRWRARDPIGHSGAVTNLYSYAYDSPLNAVDPSGLQVVCTWEQSTGHLTCDNWSTNEDNVVDTYGFAGNGLGLNNPFAEGAKNVGPLPVGFYDIKPPQSSETMGPEVFQLKPWETNDMLHRGDFWIHGARKKGNALRSSRGCPIVGPEARGDLASQMERAGGVGILEVQHGSGLPSLFSRLLFPWSLFPWLAF